MLFQQPDETKLKYYQAICIHAQTFMQSLYGYRIMSVMEPSVTNNNRDSSNDKAINFPEV